MTGPRSARSAALLSMGTQGRLTKTLSPSRWCSSERSGLTLRDPAVRPAGSRSAYANRRSTSTFNVRCAWANAGGTRCRAHERDSLERLCRYIARPALSNERLSVNDRAQVVYRLEHPFGDGTTHVVLDPIDFIARLAAPEVPLAQRARSVIERILAHLAARETGGINHPRAPPLCAPGAQLPASPSPTPP